MNRIAVIIPACIQVPEILDRFRENLRTLRHDSISRLIVLCNRLSLMHAEPLQAILSGEVTCPVEVVHDKERSVAGAWNRGIEIAMSHGIGIFLISAIDVAFHPTTIDELIRFGVDHPETPLWSATAHEDSRISTHRSVDACDFSCFMLRAATIRRHGWFDKEYKPAYFEDNDYVTRVVLDGFRPQQVLKARHTHQGSLTIKLDAEMAHHVRHWFGINEKRFMSKWRARSDRYDEISNSCWPTPFNSGKPTHWWPEQCRENYSCSSGIHE